MKVRLRCAKLTFKGKGHNLNCILLVISKDLYEAISQVPTWTFYTSDIWTHSVSYKIPKKCFVWKAQKTHLRKGIQLFFCLFKVLECPFKIGALFISLYINVIFYPFWLIGTKFFFFFLIANYSMQSWTATSRHRVTKKWKKKEI